MIFSVTILGCNGAVPQLDKYPSCQFFRLEDYCCLIDCGEGAQFQMLKLKIPKHKIDQIFISHLHGDHVFGLIGLITSFHLAGRIKPLEIFAPEGIEEFIYAQLRVNGKHGMSYELKFNVVDTNASTLIFENNKLEVFSIPLKHRVPTSGYLFKEKTRMPNIDKDKLIQFSIDREQILMLKQGHSVQNKFGVNISPEDVLKKPFLKRSYAYCSDTAFNQEIIPIINEVSLLYHEATFIDQDAELADKTQHSTAKQAALIAKRAKTSMLILGHFSSRYGNTAVIINEAKEVFENTIAGNEGMVIDVESDQNKIEINIEI